MTAKEISLEALNRATTSQSLINFPAIIQGFTARGIPESEIKPRENIFTFHAWKALGRIVRKGEHGVKVCTFREISKRKKDDKTGEEKIESFRLPWTTTVFHISQTQAV